jgi:aminoglycoside phosphotransferase (APT) family kinase protein
VTTDDPHSDETRLAAWVERHLGGNVVGISRVPRWRPAWDIDVEVKGRSIALHARGEREPTILMPFRIADEIRIHDLLEGQGLPVPHAYGLCEEPYALVMDRLAGHVDLTRAADDAERERIVDQYLELLTTIYSIPLGAAEAAGARVPADDAETALGYFRKVEADYDRLMAEAPIDPMAEFLRRWLASHVPPGRQTTCRFILYDAFQFMFADGRITGLLDFELAHIGDPMMDLAALRVRDTIKNIGDLSGLALRYEQVTGIPLAYDVADYHCVLYNAISVLSVGPALNAPPPGVDWLSYLAWYVNGARWAFEVIAELGGYQLDPVKIPAPAPTHHSPAYRHLVEELRGSRSRLAGTDYQQVALGKLANHLRRVDEVGPALIAADQDDLARVLGHSVDPEEADAALADLVVNAEPAREEELVRLLDARAQRAQLTLASPRSLIVRHPRLRSLRPGRSQQRAADDGWPAGAIPGTA